METDGLVKAEPAGGPFDARAITRPAPVLLTYYVIVSVLSTVGFPFVFLPLFFRYHTLRFRFDDDGISLSWGILFRKEVHLTYRRIQDIHVTRNLIQRWLGLANVSIQTASGNAGAEMTIEGVLQADALRDFLYTKMRGARGEDQTDATMGADLTTAPAGTDDEALALLVQIRDELRALRGASHTDGGAA